MVLYSQLLSTDGRKDLVRGTTTPMLTPMIGSEIFCLAHSMLLTFKVSFKLVAFKYFHVVCSIIVGSNRTAGPPSIKTYNLRSVGCDETALSNRPRNKSPKAFPRERETSVFPLKQKNHLPSRRWQNCKIAMGRRRPAKPNSTRETRCAAYDPGGHGGFSGWQIATSTSSRISSSASFKA